MKVEMKTLTEFDAKYIDVKAEVRYWEDADFNRRCRVHQCCIERRC